MVYVFGFACNFCCQAVVGHAQMHSVQVKFSLPLPFWFCLKLVSVPVFALSVFTSLCKWIKATESLGRPLHSAQKERFNKKEQIVPTEIICWTALGLWSANASRKTSEIIISNLKKSYLYKVDHWCLCCAAVQYNPKGEISLLLVNLDFVR